MKYKLGLVAGMAGLALATGAQAQSTTPPLPPGVTPPTTGTGGTTVVTRPDGTRIETTVLGPTSLRVVITGGPVYGANPVTVNFTNITTSGTTQTYTGDVTQGGVTSPFTCNLNTSTGTVTGSGACADVLGSQSTTPTTPTNPPTTPTTPTTPTPPTTTPTTPPPTTPAEPTMVAPDGTVITVATGNLLLLTAVQTDQFLNSLLGDALNSSFGQAFVAARTQVLQAGRTGRLSSNDAYRGLSAGEVDPPLGAWVNVEGVRLKDDRLGRDMDGGAKSAAIGVDYLLSSTAVLGVFAAYGDTDLDGPDARYESKGWTGGAYGSVLVTPQISVTGVIGLNKSNVTNSRTFGILSSTGDTDREQVFGSLSVEGRLAVAENLALRPVASVFFSDSDTDAYVDDAGRTVAGFNNKLSIGRVGATLVYEGDRISPYVSAAWDHYLSDEFGADGDFGRIGAGVAVGLTETTYVSIGASTTVGKKDERETLFAFTLGGRF